VPRSSCIISSKPVFCFKSSPKLLAFLALSPSEPSIFLGSPRIILSALSSFAFSTILSASTSGFLSVITPTGDARNPLLSHTAKPVLTFPKSTDIIIITIFPLNIFSKTSYNCSASSVNYCISLRCSVSFSDTTSTQPSSATIVLIAQFVPQGTVLSSSIGFP